METDAIQTRVTETLSVTIAAPFEQVSRDLADPTTHPEWATEFFTGPAIPQDDGSVRVQVPMLGGEARFRVDADVERGRIDLYLAPADASFGPPLPVRLVPNGDGVDVLWTLARAPHHTDEQWEDALDSMRRELHQLKQRHEQM